MRLSLGQICTLLIRAHCSTSSCFKFKNSIAFGASTLALFSFSYLILPTISILSQLPNKSSIFLLHDLKIDRCPAILCRKGTRRNNFNYRSLALKFSKVVISSVTINLWLVFVYVLNLLHVLKFSGKKTPLLGRSFSFLTRWINANRKKKIIFAANILVCLYSLHTKIFAKKIKKNWRRGVIGHL